MIKVPTVLDLFLSEADVSCITVAFTLLADVDPEALDTAVAEVRKAESIGPILDPSAWVHGPNAKNAEHYKKILSTAATLVRALRAARGDS